MKKLFLLTAALLLSCLAFSQGASVGNGAVLSVIPRAEVNPYLPLTKEGQDGVEFNNSSLYTLFEGNVGRHFSYSVCNHWLNTTPKELYQNTFSSENANWVDWVNVTWSGRNLYGKIGKLATVMGSSEIDAYDYDTHWDLSSQFWNNSMVYLWGGELGYVNEAENTTFLFQLQSSRFNPKPFSEGKLACTFAYRGEYGPWNILCALNDMEYDRIHLMLIGLSNSVSFTDELSLTADVIFRTYGNTFGGINTIASFDWCRDKFNLKIKGGYENTRVSGEPLGITSKYFFAGAAFEYFPLRESKDLRLHFVAATNKEIKAVSLNLGVTYFLNLNLFNR